MPSIATAPAASIGQIIGNGHCVAYVRHAAGLGHTSSWRRGQHVLALGDDCALGTAIATFDANGRYGNHTDGRSHAAVYMGPAPGGIRVIDQWQGHPCAERVIRNKGGGPAVNDASRYYLIETEPP